MSQDNEKNPPDPFLEYEMELTRKANERLREMAKTHSISYIDDDGYIVRRSPDGVVTRISSSPVR